MLDFKKKLLQEVRRHPVTLVPGRKVVSVQPGEWTSPYKGKGYEPFGYRDFEIGDDPRQINLPATARRGEPTIVERVALRDFKMMVVVDHSPSMWARQKFDAQLAAAVLLLYSAWQSEITFGLAVCSGNDLRSFRLGVGSRHFYNLYRRLLQIFSNRGIEQVAGTRVSISRCLPPNAMLAYCSDFLDPEGGLVDVASLWKLVRRYDVIPVILQDELEYDFPTLSHGSFVPFSNPETGAWQKVWLSPKSAEDIRTVHKARFLELIGLWESRGARCLHLGTPNVKAIARQFNSYFIRRLGRSP